MKRILLVIVAVLAVAALALAVGGVRRAEDEATLWDEALEEESA